MKPKESPAERKIPLPSEPETEKAVAAAKEFCDAWLERDYQTLFALTTPSSMLAKDGEYGEFVKFVKAWRDSKANRDLKLGEITVDDLATDITLSQAVQSVLMMCADGLEDEVFSLQWPDWDSGDAAFVSHTFKGELCYVVMVREEDGDWKALCPPGQLTRDLLEEMTHEEKPRREMPR